MGCAGCAMHKGPQPSRGPQQSEGPSAIWRVHDNLRGPSIWGASSNLRGPNNPRAPSNLRGPQQSEGSPTIWGPHQSEGPPAIWGPAICGALSNLTGPRLSDGPQQLRVGPLRAVVISLNLSSNAVNEVNHLWNCSTARWLHYALSSTLSDVCTVPHVVADTRTIIFKIEGHQKLYKVPCQKSGWATWQCG